MKRYWLFLMEEFYPAGGMYDFHSSYDTLEEAKAAEAAEKEDGWQSSIYDSQSPLSSTDPVNPT